MADDMQDMFCGANNCSLRSFSGSVINHFKKPLTVYSSNEIRIFVMSKIPPRHY